MKLQKNSLYDTAIIGGGPAGIFAALKLSNKKILTLLIEKQSNLGGIALRSDVNLDYYRGLPAVSRLGEQVFGNRRVANNFIREVYRLLKKFGLPFLRDSRKDKIRNRNLFHFQEIEYVDPGIFPLEKSTIDLVLDNIRKNLEGSRYMKIFLNSEVITIRRGKYKQWQILIAIQKNIVKVEANNIIIATGKLSIEWLVKTLDSLKIHYKNNPQIDVGVRIEGLKKYFDTITKGCLNPKILLKHGGAQARTFCWCVGGRVINYELCGAKILDGQHLHTHPTLNTNFGIVVTTRLPSCSSNFDFGIKFAKYINSIDANKIILQLAKDFIEDKPTSRGKLKSNPVKPTLTHFGLVNIRSYFPLLVTNRMLQLIDSINKTYGDVISPNCLIYAPVIERLFPIIPLTCSMETSRKGIFLIGDCSGKVTGVISGAATGLAAACYVGKICKNLHN